APAEQPGSVGAVVDVALIDVALVAGAGEMKQIAVAGAVDSHPGADCEPAFLALEDGACDPTFLHDRGGHPGMEHEMNAGAEHDLLAQQLQVLRVDRRGPSNDAVKSCGALLPIGVSRPIGACPIGRRWARD